MERPRRRSWDRTLRLIFVIVALLPAVRWAQAYDTMFAAPGDIDRFTDAVTYLAAGERLNVGHSLYGPLKPDDRPVLIDPSFFHSPLVSPPTIAVIWRPFAAMPYGLTVWLALVWVSLLGTVGWLVYRTGLLGLAMALLLSEPVGNQLAIGNVTAFFPTLLVLCWLFRERPWVASIVSLMTAIKITPGTLYGWSRIGRRRAAVIWALGSMGVILAVTAIGAGIGSFGDYLGVAADTKPSPFSLAGMTGLPWVTYAVLIGGTLAALVIRNEAWSFAIATTALVAGTPAFYKSSWVPFLALLAPLAFSDGARVSALWPFAWRPSVRRPPRAADPDGVTER